MKVRKSAVIPLRVALRAKGYTQYFQGEEKGRRGESFSLSFSFSFSQGS
jgi:hypothetical protein